MAAVGRLTSGRLANWSNDTKRLLKYSKMPFSVKSSEGFLEMFCRLTFPASSLYYLVNLSGWFTVLYSSLQQTTVTVVYSYRYEYYSIVIVIIE